MIGKIIGIGAYLPEKVLTNDDMAKIVETNDEWITERTGIKQRHIANGVDETTTYMASEAAKRAIEDAGIDPNEIELIIVASTSPDMAFPSLACNVQAAIGIDGCACFDMNSACPGWITAYNTAQSFIEAGHIKTALVVGAECLSNFMDWEDRGTCILFGDGAGATILQADGNNDTNMYLLKGSGKRGGCLFAQTRKQPKKYDDPNFEKSTFINMDGKEVFKFAVSEVPAIINELAQKYDIDLNEVDHFILHQANKRIIEAAAKKLGMPIEKFPMNIQDTGNTSSASIPILLRKMKDEGTLVHGQKIIMSSFGGGLTWGANYLIY